MTITQAVKLLPNNKVRHNGYDRAFYQWLREVEPEFRKLLNNHEGVVNNER